MKPTEAAKAKMIYLTPEQIERVRREAFELRVNQSEVIRRALNQYFEAKK